MRVNLSEKTETAKNDANKLERISNLPTHLKPKCDSLQLFIRLDRCEVLDKTFRAKYRKIYIVEDENGTEEEFFEDIEVDKLDRQNSLFIEKDSKGVITSNGVTNVKFQYACLMLEGQVVGQKEYCLVTINSKQLQNQYFKGITKSTIKDLYNYVISAGVIKCSFETFVNSRVSDVDICFDILDFGNKHHRDLLNVSKSKVAIERYSYVDYKGKDKSTLQYHNRIDARKSSVLPYLKIYAKSEELIGHSTKFYKAFIAPQEDLESIVLQGITRVEYTLANRRQMKSFGLDIATLKDVINLSDKEYTRVLNMILDNYNGMNIRAVANDNELSRTDLLIVGLITELVEQGLSAPRIIDVAGLYGNSPSDKSKNKRRVRELVEYVTNKNKLAENEVKQKQVNEVLQFMGIYKE